jgi:hypothetical protein
MGGLERAAAGPGDLLALGFEAAQTAHRGIRTQGLQDGDLEKSLVDVSVQARVDAINSLLSKVRDAARHAFGWGYGSVSPRRAG